MCIQQLAMLPFFKMIFNSENPNNQLAMIQKMKAKKKELEDTLNNLQEIEKKLKK